jgi:16S rRNA (guanine527-N7)-methyltransferase
MSLTPEVVRGLLAPFSLALKPEQVDKLIVYLDLLTRWNKKINLTSVRGAEESVTRHFGESLYLSRWVELQGASLDIGSGAGFPGLALKLVFPDLSVSLLEPVGKKRAFLKEVIRACGMEPVEVRPERLEELVAKPLGCKFDSVTSRAVGVIQELVPQAARLLKSGGKICLWLSHEDGVKVSANAAGFRWQPPLQLPTARKREIWIGISEG